MKVLHSGRLRPYPQSRHTRLEMLARDKHFNLLRILVNYGRKKFYNIKTGPTNEKTEAASLSNLIKLFCPSRSKLACLNLANPF
jgi:hypothetical protein